MLHYPNAIIAFMLGLAAACLTDHIRLQNVNWTVLILSVLTITFSLISFGQLLGLISIITRNWIAVQRMALGLLMVFCGAIIPIDVFPGLISAITHVLPITNGLIAARAAFAGVNLNRAGVNILSELLVGFGYCTTSFAAFRAFEARVRRRRVGTRHSLEFLIGVMSSCLLLK
jgi:ABC-type uncharacterized transport system permease subunit